MPPRTTIKPTIKPSSEPIEQTSTKDPYADIGKPSQQVPARTPSATSNASLDARAKIRADHYPDAINKIVELMGSDNPLVAIAAAKLIIEHSIGKAPKDGELQRDNGIQDMASVMKILSENGLLNTQVPPPSLDESDDGVYTLSPEEYKVD